MSFLINAFGKFKFKSIFFYMFFVWLAFLLPAATSETTSGGMSVDVSTLGMIATVLFGGIWTHVIWLGKQHNANKSDQAAQISALKSEVASMKATLDGMKDDKTHKLIQEFLHKKSEN